MSAECQGGQNFELGFEVGVGISVPFIIVIIILFLRWGDGCCQSIAPTSWVLMGR